MPNLPSKTTGLSVPPSQRRPGAASRDPQRSLRLGPQGSLEPSQLAQPSLGFHDIHVRRRYHRRRDYLHVQHHAIASPQAVRQVRPRLPGRLPIRLRAWWHRALDPVRHRGRGWHVLVNCHDWGRLRAGIVLAADVRPV